MAFTWHRGKAGASTGDSTDASLVFTLANMEVDPNTIVRAIILRYVIDLEAIDKDANLNSNCSVTWGLVMSSTSDNEPNPPADGPATAPASYPVWWDGAVFTNAYGFTTGSSVAAMMATGNMRREAPFALNTDSETPWNQLYAVFEIQDGAESFSGFRGQVWYQVLTAPKGT